MTKLIQKQRTKNRNETCRNYEKSKQGMQTVRKSK